MINDWPILTIITFLPLLGVLFILPIGMLFKGDEETINRNSRTVALLFTIGTFLASPPTAQPLVNTSSPAMSLNS